MEELKLLVEMVANLPGMALWVIALFFFYKLFIVGSIYGVIRLGINQLHSWLVHRKVNFVEIRPLLEGMTISGSKEALIAQIHRIRGRGLRIKSDYIHEASVDWLREAIDAKMLKDLSEGKVSITE